MMSVEMNWKVNAEEVKHTFAHWFATELMNAGQGEVLGGVGIRP
jgi:hypothetical protein